MMEYRRDIDGLRALAVLPVIFFHAGFETFKGGFLGVDIFFVISGYLITSILLVELAKDKFSIVNFYERRARRILPALFLVLGVTYLAGVVFMPAFEFQEFSASLISVIAFLSNIFFYFEIDYFSLAAEEMPLLHTWSLAIEEQFYIVFPPLLYAIYRFAKPYLLISLIIFTLLSFFSVIVLNASEAYSASFYWPSSRAWELLAGAICALISHNHVIRSERGYIADIALAVLIACMMAWSDTFTHPGYLTIIPVIATCVLILFSNRNSLTYKFLSLQPMVFIGLISYSLYLWHQPIFAFLRIKSIGALSIDKVILAISLTFIFAFLSYRLIEVPFRNKARFNRQFIFSTSSISLAFFLSIGMLSYYTGGLEQRFSSLKSYENSIENSPKRQACHASNDYYINPDDACSYSGEKVTWAVFGDSHAVEPAYALSELMQEQNIGLTHHSFSSCPPALNYVLKGKSKCTQWLNETLNFLEHNEQIETVLIAFRYSVAIYGDNVNFFPEIPDKVILDIESKKELSDSEKLAIYWQSLEEIITRLLASNKKVILLEPIPELPTHIGRAVSAFSIFGDSTLVDLNASTSKAYYQSRHEYILKKLRSLQQHDNLILVNVYDLLCHETGCPATIGNVALYFDDDHLSVEGSKLLFERLQRAEHIY